MLAQSAERGADNAKVVSSTPTRTRTIFFAVLFPFLVVVVLQHDLKTFKADIFLFFSTNTSRKIVKAVLNHQHSRASLPELV